MAVMTFPSARDYLPEGASPPEPAPPPRSPRPGHGRVWVNGGAADFWYASWQDEQRVQDSPIGTREQAISAAQKMPAADRVIFSELDGDYVDLDEWLSRTG
jgi:hypothetical protein